MKTKMEDFLQFEDLEINNVDDRKSFFRDTWINGRRFNVDVDYTVGYGIDFEGGRFNS